MRPGDGTDGFHNSCEATFMVGGQCPARPTKAGGEAVGRYSGLPEESFTRSEDFLKEAGFRAESPAGSLPLDSQKISQPRMDTDQHRCSKVGRRCRSGGARIFNRPVPPATFRPPRGRLEAGAPRNVRLTLKASRRRRGNEALTSPPPVCGFTMMVEMESPGVVSCEIVITHEACA